MNIYGRNKKFCIKGKEWKRDRIMYGPSAAPGSIKGSQSQQRNKIKTSLIKIKGERNKKDPHIQGMDRSRCYSLSLIHISEPTRLGMISYAVFCLKKKKRN